MNVFVGGVILGGNSVHKSLLLGGNSTCQSIIDRVHVRYLEIELDNSNRPRFSPPDVISDNVEVNLSILDGGSGIGDGEEEEEEEEEDSEEIHPYVKIPGNMQSIPDLRHVCCNLN